MSRWPSEKHFCAWLNVAPNNRISGGKILSSKPRKNSNRAAAALRLAAQSAMQSKTAIGAFIRRIKSRLGAPTAINAGAHKLARLLYRMLKFGKAYVETGQQAYEKFFKQRALRNLQRRGELLQGEKPNAATVVASFMLLERSLIRHRSCSLRVLDFQDTGAVQRWRLCI